MTRANRSILWALHRRADGTFSHSGVSLLVLIGAAGCSDSGDSPPRHNAREDAGTVCVACEDACEEEIPLEPPFPHQEGDLGYGDPPPAGGTHSGCWAAWGVHEEAVRPENWVHNLEHGGVVLLHACPDGCDEEVGKLAAFAEGKSQILVSPYPEMSARFAAVAWEYRLSSSCLDMEAVARFYEAHAGSANAPEPGVTSDPPGDCL